MAQPVEVYQSVAFGPEVDVEPGEAEGPLIGTEPMSGLGASLTDGEEQRLMAGLRRTGQGKDL
jgi:hypothetical protein